MPPCIPHGIEAANTMHMRFEALCYDCKSHARAEAHVIGVPLPSLQELWESQGTPKSAFSRVLSNGMLPNPILYLGIPCAHATLAPQYAGPYTDTMWLLT